MSDVLSPGEHLGPFRIVRRLGGGAMGVVFLAVEEELDREVALKIISPELAGDDGFRERFTREARAQARLNSGHVVQVYRYGEQDGRLFIASQLVPDGDLGALLGEFGPPLLPNALELIAQVAEGVADAHDAGLIHRDIKTANILVRRRSEGLTAYVADFGIARTEDSHQTKTGVAVGTPSYMAPELHLGRQATVASDVYSLGCLMWATLTGSPPYAGTTEFQVIRAHMDAPVRQLAAAGPVIGEVNRILRTAMAKDPAQRYPSANAMRTDLQRLVARMDGMPVPPVRPLAPNGGPPPGVGGPGPASGPGSGPASGPGSHSAPGSTPGSASGPAGRSPGASSGHDLPTATPASYGGSGASGPGASRPGSGSGGYAATNVQTPGGTGGQGGPGGSSGARRTGPGSSGARPFTTPGGPTTPGGSNSNLKAIVILVAVGVVLIGGVIFGVAALNNGGDDKGGGDDETTGQSGPTSGGTATGPATVEAYCSAFNSGPGSESFVASGQLNDYINWGKRLESTGAPADMPDDAQAGFELKVSDLTGLSEGDFDNSSYFADWENFLSPSQTDNYNAWKSYNESNC